MDEKTTNELNHILKSCTTLSHLEAALTELPEKERLTLKCYLEELLETKGLNKADVIRAGKYCPHIWVSDFSGRAPCQPR